MISPRNLVVLGDGARLDLIESHVMLGAGRHAHQPGQPRRGRPRWRSCDTTACRSASADGSLIGKTHYELAADARLTQTLATLGGALVRNEISAVMAGAGIEAGLNGLYFTRERQHVDNNILVDHAAPGSVSDQFYKGMLDGQSHAVFAGKIVVRRDAQKTNAYQANNNLLLSPDAEIDTKPELEIFADDVKCSHGATAGELDERELFYLRSRGLDPATARSVLTFAFAGEVLERFANPGDRRPGQARAAARPAGRRRARGADMSALAGQVRAAPGLDVARVRADFPCLQQTIHGRPLVFLDTAASAQKPAAVIDAHGAHAAPRLRQHPPRRVRR